MTNRVRKGNDVRIRWRVDRLGEPVNLEEASIKVELVDRFRRSVPVTFSVEGNVVIIDFAAANQKTNGVHTAVLIVSDGYTTNTVDKCNIIDLVEHSCEESCLDVDAEGMVWIDVASNLAFPANGKDGIGIDSIEQTVTAEDSEGVNKIEITLSNGEKVCFEVRNGRRGSPGYTPRKGVDYSDGKSLYELLVDAGLFEGTLDDFLARFENARTANETATKRANEAAGNAETAAKEATASAEKAGSAAIAANTAKNNANTATTKANEAAQSANDAADRANAAAEAVELYENRLENVEGKVTELDERVDAKPNIDGYYDGMAVGYARNLIMPNTPEGQEFRSRQSGGGVIEDGVAVIDKVKGKSVVWNQILKDNDTHKVFQGPQLWSQLSSPVEPIHLLAGHKYLGICRGLLISGGQIGLRDGGSGLAYRPNTGYVIFFNSDKNYDNAYLQCYWNEDRVADFYVSFIDLTLMFGAGNEPSTYEEFLARKPFIEDEYAYNEGTIVSNNVEAVKSTGVNLWDEEWEVGGYNLTTGAKIPLDNAIRSKGYIGVRSGVSYYGKKSQSFPYLRVLFYDANKKIISNSVIGGEFVVPDGCVYLTIYAWGGTASSYGYDICINISDPTINGKYFPYEEHTLALDWVKAIKDENGAALFPDGLRRAGTAFDEVRSGKAIKRVGVVDLGTLVWRFDSISGVSIFWTTIDDKVPNSLNLLTTKYLTASFYTSKEDKTISATQYFTARNELNVIDSSYTNAADLKASLAGVMLYYELAEPIEVEFDEKNLTYPVVSGGMEEAIAIGDSTPFRADIGYGIDAVKTILKLKERVTELENK